MITTNRPRSSWAAAIRGDEGFAPQQGGGGRRPYQGGGQQGGYGGQRGGGQQGGGPQGGAPRQPQPQPQHPDEDLGPAFPSEASGMDDVPF